MQDLLNDFITEVDGDLWRDKIKRAESAAIACEKQGCLTCKNAVFERTYNVDSNIYLCRKIGISIGCDGLDRIEQHSRGMEVSSFLVIRLPSENPRDIRTLGVSLIPSGSVEYREYKKHVYTGGGVFLPHRDDGPSRIEYSEGKIYKVWFSLMGMGGEHPFWVYYDQASPELKETLIRDWLQYA